MTSPQPSLQSGDDLVALLDEAKWKVPHLSDNLALLSLVFDAAKKHPDRMMDLIGTMTHIEHRSNHGFEVLGGLIRLLWSDTPFEVPQLLEAILDAGEYFSMDNQSKLMDQALAKAIRAEGEETPWEAGAQDVLRAQLAKHQGWGNEHSPWKPMTSFIFQIQEDSRQKFSWEMGPLEERRMSIYRRRLALLLEAGVPLDGSLEIAAQNYPGKGAYDNFYIPFRVLLEAGADWRGVMDSPHFTAKAKEDLRQEPIVRRAMLTQEVRGEREHITHTPKPKRHM